jgi:hypothetical protein
LEMERKLKLKSDHGIVLDIILAFIIFRTVAVTWLSSEGAWVSEINRISFKSSMSFAVNLNDNFGWESGLVVYITNKKYPLTISELLISDDDHAECEYWPEYPLLCVISV